jgi:putative transposase
MDSIELLQDYLVDQESGLKELLTWFLNQVMLLEALQQTVAEPYQRVEGRKAHRNGYKKRNLKTRVGEITLKKPQLRESSFETKVFDKYSRVEKALINAIAESYIQGTSTRKIQDIVCHLGLDQLSPSSILYSPECLDFIYSARLFKFGFDHINRTPFYRGIISAYTLEAIWPRMHH